MGEVRNVYIILIGISEEKRPLLRARFGWENDSKKDLKDLTLET
jgi:hypothetical protein